MSCPPELGALPAVLFVCMGNICRSPTAEAVCRHKAQSRGIAVKLDSAGTHAYHCGEMPDKRSIAAGKVRGYDFAGITARQVCHADFEQFDLILAADKQNLLALKQQCPVVLQDKLHLMRDMVGAVGKDVPDPYYGGTGGFDHVLDLLEDVSDAVLERVDALTTGARSALS